MTVATIILIVACSAVIYCAGVNKGRKLECNERRVASGLAPLP